MKFKNLFTRGKHVPSLNFDTLRSSTLKNQDFCNQLETMLWEMIPRNEGEGGGIRHIIAAYLSDGTHADAMHDYLRRIEPKSLGHNSDAYKVYEFVRKRLKKGVIEKTKQTAHRSINP